MSKKKITLGLVVLVVGLLVLSLSACAQQDTVPETTTASGNGWGSYEEEAGNTAESGSENADITNPEPGIDRLVNEANEGGFQGKGRRGEESGDLNESYNEIEDNSGQRRGQGQVQSQEDVQELASGQNLDQAQGNGNGRGSGNGAAGRGAGGQGQGRSLEPLSDAEVEALVRAIEEEFGAQALYQSVLNTFGDVDPFNSIVQSEAQHAAALVRQAEKYGVTVPEFPSLQGLPVFSTLSEACQAGVAAEIADAALYDELIPITTHSDLIQVFENLRNASLDNHLPEFESCQ